MLKSDLERVALPPLNAIHDEEVEMINAIQALCRAGDEPGLATAVAELGEHFEAHFTLEEDNMGRTEFSDLEEHRAEHDAMRERYASIAEDADLAGMTAFFEEELPAWFVDHVASLDVVTAEHVAGWQG
ncbi:MAG: hemerythrin family protein [Planctomycetota bacterium]|nr:hemerythrin family protein [Planctomycetota bacterium]